MIQGEVFLSERPLAILDLPTLNKPGWGAINGWSFVAVPHASNAQGFEGFCSFGHDIFSKKDCDAPDHLVVRREVEVDLV